MIPYLALISAIGLADAITASYLVLFASDDVGLSPLQVGIVTTAATLSGIALTSIAGRWVDVRRTRVPLVGALITAAVGFGLLTVVRGFVPLLVVCLLVGAINVGFPQVFALERMRPDRGPGDRPTALLRGAWSISWAVGPLLASGLVVWSGYPALFGGGAALVLIAAIAVAAVHRPTRSDGAPSPRLTRTARRSVVAPVLSVLLFHAAMYIASFVLPLLLTREVDVSSAWVGVAFAVGAGVEVVAALILAALASRIRPVIVVIASAAALALYLAGIALVPTLVSILVLQVLRGFAIAGIGIAAIDLLQRALAPSIGAATALFSNAVAVGSVVSGVGAGALVQTIGIPATLGVCATIAAGSVVAAVVAAARRHRSVSVSDPAGTGAPGR